MFEDTKINQNEIPENTVERFGRKRNCGHGLWGTSTQHMGIRGLDKQKSLIWSLTKMTWWRNACFSEDIKVSDWLQLQGNSSLLWMRNFGPAGVSRVPYWLLGDLGAANTSWNHFRIIWCLFFLMFHFDLSILLQENLKKAHWSLSSLIWKQERWVPEEFPFHIYYQSALLAACHFFFFLNFLFIQASGSDYTWFVKRIQAFSYLFHIDDRHFLCYLI